MGYSITKQDNNIQYNLREFICDKEAEVSSVPTKCLPGSKLFCIDTGARYMLNTSLEWVKISSGSSSGGGSGSGSGDTPGSDTPDSDDNCKCCHCGPDLDFATIEDIDDMFANGGISFKDLEFVYTL